MFSSASRVLPLLGSLPPRSSVPCSGTHCPAHPHCSPKEPVFPKGQGRGLTCLSGPAVPSAWERDLTTRRLRISETRSESKALGTCACSCYSTAGPCVGLIPGAQRPPVCSRAPGHLQLSSPIVKSEMKEAQSSQVSSSTRQSRVQGRLGQGGQAEDLKRYVTVPSTDLASGRSSGKVP